MCTFAYHSKSVVKKGRIKIKALISTILIKYETILLIINEQICIQLLYTLLIH